MTATTPPELSEAEANRFTVARLHSSAPMLAAALSGIETIAELLGATMAAGDREPGELAETVTPARMYDLVGASAALACYAKETLVSVIGRHGEDRLLWGSDYHLTGEYLHRDPD